MHPSFRNPGIVALALGLLGFLCLLPFCNKAFHIDDPIFLWPAQQMLAANGHVFSAPVNWYGTTSTLGEVTNHFPLVSALEAPVIAVVGFSEVALHLEFAIFAALAIAGVYRLANEQCDRPLTATLLLLVSPAFFVSATTLMSDVPMLAMWVWSLVMWKQAQRRERPGMFVVAGCFITLAALCKYPGIELVPLLAVAGISRRYLRWQIAALALPVAALVAAQWYTRHVTGHGVVSIALSFAMDRPKLSALPGNVTTTLSFMGGGFAAIAIVWLMRAPRRQVLGAVIVAGVIAALVRWLPQRMLGIPNLTGSNRAIIGWHAAIFCGLAVIMFWMTIAHLLERRDRDAWLLLLWVLGVFVFASVVNWTTNARSVLPMGPALAILAVRSARARRIAAPWIALPIAASAALSLIVAIADYQIAAAARDAANLIHTRARTFHGTLWFTGHWGFQWYMEHNGAVPVDNEASVLRAGDLYVLPLDNVDIVMMPKGTLSPVDQIDRPVISWISTINAEYGGEFYSSAGGPLPYVFGPMSPRRFIVFRVTQNILPPKKEAKGPGQSSSVTAQSGAASGVG